MTIPVTLIPWAWAIAAIAIALLELQAPGSYFIWFACAAALTAIATFIREWSFSAQLTIFIASSAICCIGGFFIYRRWVFDADESEALNRRDLNLLGAVGIASNSFVNGQGRVRIGDSVWAAEASEEIENGAPIVVRNIRGTTLLVCRKMDRE